MGPGYQKWLYFGALLAVALTLAPGLAHLLELPNKMILDREEYFVVQSIYRGWSLLGIVVMASLVTTLALAISLRGQRTPMIWATVAFLCIVGAQVLFWTWTYPANLATSNWTEALANWETLRAQWEYSHAAAAVLDLGAMLALIASVLSWCPARDIRPRHLAGVEVND